MCGNGIRCLAKFLCQLEGKKEKQGSPLSHANHTHDSPHYPPPHHHTTSGDDKSGESRSYRISTLAGVIVPVVRGDGLVTVDMGMPILEGEALRCCMTE